MEEHMRRVTIGNVSYWVDDQLNRWDTAVYTKDEAVKTSAELKGCTDCVNCERCVNCTTCIYCADCLDCCVCERSKDSENCHHCVACIKCDNCLHCDDCSECTFSQYLVSCRTCTDCFHCFRCDHCTNIEHATKCLDVGYTEADAAIMDIPVMRMVDSLHNFDSAASLEIKTKLFRFTLTENGKCSLLREHGTLHDSNNYILYAGESGIGSIIQKNNCGALNREVLCLIQEFVTALNKTTTGEMPWVKIQ